jgi:hypothetical protein
VKPVEMVMFPLEELERLASHVTALRTLVGDIAHAFGVGDGEVDGVLDAQEMVDLFIAHGLANVDRRGRVRAGELLATCLMASDERAEHPAQ